MGCVSQPFCYCSTVEKDGMGLYIDTERKERKKKRVCVGGYRFNDDLCQIGYWLNDDIIGFSIALACWLWLKNKNNIKFLTVVKIRHTTQHVKTRL